LRPVELFKQPLELLVVHVLLLGDDLHVHLLLVQLLLVVLELDQGVLLLPPGLVQHVGHLVDPVQQHVHLLLHVLPLPAALVHGVLQHLKVAVLPQQLAVPLLLVLLHPDQLALQLVILLPLAVDVRQSVLLLLLQPLRDHSALLQLGLNRVQFVEQLLLVALDPSTLAGVPLHLLAQDVDLLVGLVQLQLGLLLSNLVLAGSALHPLKFFSELVHLASVLVPLRVAARQGLLDLVKLLLNILIFRLRVLKLGAKSVDLALRFLNLLLHLFHLHLAPLVVGLVESQLSLGASQLVLRLLQLVLQLCVLNGAVDAQCSEPVHLRRRLPLVTEVPRSLQLNVYPVVFLSKSFNFQFQFGDLLSSVVVVVVLEVLVA